MGENINDGVNHTAKDKGQPPMSAGVGFVHEAPEENGVDDEHSKRVQKVMAGDPPRVCEICRVDDIFHQGTRILPENETVVTIRSPRKQAKRQVRQNRTPQKSGFGEFELCAEFLFNGGVDDQMRGECVHRFLNTLSKSSTGGLSAGSWLG